MSQEQQPQAKASFVDSDPYWSAIWARHAGAVSKNEPVLPAAVKSATSANEGGANATSAIDEREGGKRRYKWLMYVGAFLLILIIVAVAYMLLSNKKKHDTIVVVREPGHGHGHGHGSDGEHHGPNVLPHDN